MMTFPKIISNVPTWGLCRYYRNQIKAPCTADGRKCAQAQGLVTFDTLGPLPGPEYGYRFSLGGMVDNIKVPKPHTYSVLDYDHVRDDTLGISNELDRIVPNLRDEIEYLMSQGYVEVSVSGTGYHCIISDDNLPPDIQPIIKADSRPEVFVTDKYCWMTGDVVSASTNPIQADERVRSIISRQVEYATKNRAIHVDPSIHADPPAQVDPPAPQPPPEDVGVDSNVDSIADARDDLKNNPIYNGNITGYPSPSEAALALCRIISKNVNDLTDLDVVFKTSPFFKQHYSMNDRWTRSKQRLTYEAVIGTLAYKRLDREDKIPRFIKNTTKKIPDDIPVQKKSSRVKMKIPPAPEFTGFLREVEDYYNKSSIIPQPEFAKGVAIAIASVVLGRHYQTNGGVYSSMYMAFIATTGQGKEHIITTIHKILRSSGASKLIGAANYGSGLEFHRSIREQPRQIMVKDEAGLSLAQVKSNARAGNNYHMEIQTTLLELWGRCGSTHHPSYKPSRHKATKEQLEDINEAYKPIESPAVSYVMISTPSTMLAALSTDDAAIGYLSRVFYICGSNEIMKTLPQPMGKYPISPQIISWIHAYGSRGCGEDGFSEDPDMVEKITDIPITGEAQEIFEKYYARLVKEMIRHGELNNIAINASLVRLPQYLFKISMIFAISDDSMIITKDHAERGVQFVMHYSMIWYQDYLKAKLTYVNKHDETEKKVIGYIKKQTLEWVPRSKIIRDVFRGDLSYDTILMKLEHQNSITCRRGPNGTAAYKLNE